MFATASFSLNDLSSICLEEKNPLENEIFSIGILVTFYLLIFCVSSVIDSWSLPKNLYKSAVPA